MIAVILEVHKAAEQAVIGSHRVIGVEECLGCNKPVLVHAEAFPADEGVVPFVLGDFQQMVDLCITDKVIGVDGQRVEGHEFDGVLVLAVIAVWKQRR